MASSYPGAVDALTNPTATDPMNSVTVPHATQHANANDAIEAIQAELGTDPAGAAATVRDRFDAIEATGWVTSTRIADGTIVDADVNASAAIAQSKIASLTSDLAAKLTTPGAWTTYSPTLNGLTLGNGTIRAVYSRVGKIVIGSIEIAFGSTTSVGSVIYPTLPLAQAGSWVGNINVSAYDTSAGTSYMLSGEISYGYVFIKATGGTSGAVQDTSATVPFTWATGDTLSLIFTYETSA